MRNRADDFDFIVREKEENEEFIELLSTAIDELENAKLEITYSIFPDANCVLIKKIDEIISSIRDIEIDVENGDNFVFKPQLRDKNN